MNSPTGRMLHSEPARQYTPDHEAAMRSIREVPDDYVFTPVDYTDIEVRFLAWANAQLAADAFRSIGRP